MSMETIIARVKQFQSEIFPSKRELFEKLAQGQSPDVMFITCADSRIDPCLITQSWPRDIFVARNAENLVPPQGSGRGSEAASVEFAVKGLGVREIVVCGHTECSAMKAVADPKQVEGLPAVRDWLSHAQEGLRALGAADDAPLDPAQRLRALIEQNVLAQLRNLMTHESVADAVSAGRLSIHGWVYKIETGVVLQYDLKTEFFLSLT